MKFGQYELLEPIAIGGMAEVFKGRVVAAEGFEKYVAIKRILPDLAADERFVKMLLTEARIHSALSHRNIVQIHDLGISEKGEYFIVLEYVEGYDLRVITEQLAREKEIIPEALSLYIAAEVAEGLHFAHEMRGPDGQPLGLVHRDVTPSNVLISFAGEVKLSDFGLAKRRHDNSVVGSLKGNLAYMSPEQAKQAPLDRRTDIFSLGALLFELLTGRRLREITDEIAGWSQVASGVVPSARRLRPDLPAPIERLLDMALAPDPAHRFPDAAAFGVALRDALAKMNIPVGASDLAALLGVVTPPRRARSLMLEASKVIRLGSEAQALREAIAAPVTPAPVVPPGMTPASPRARDLAAVRYRDPAATPQVEVHPPAESRDPLATPLPAAPLPPARTRGYTPHQPSARPRRPSGATPAATPRPPVARPRSPAPTPAEGNRPAGERQRNTLGPTPSGGNRPVANRPRPQPTPPVGNPLGPPPGDPRGPLFRTPSYGVRRPTGPIVAIGPAGAVTSPAAPRRPTPSPRQAPFGQPARQAALVQPREQRETARVQLRPRRRWGGSLFLLLLLLAGAAAGVHFYLIPLDVLVTWREPAGLSIASDPDGAALLLDGVPLARPAPTTVSVRRDRAEHVIDAKLPGYRPARETVRYDRSVGLAFLLRLEKDPSFAPPPATDTKDGGAAAEPDASTPHAAAASR
jgi:hypothetical protein